MKKRNARIVVYFGLTCLTSLVLSHPYIWQSIFGPKIKGEPLWAWQQEFRARCIDRPPNATLLDKVLNVLKIDPTPMRWIGQFDYCDPELLPVVIGFAGDPDERVRIQVVYALSEAIAQESAIKTLVHMLDDSSPDIRSLVITMLQGSLAAKKPGPGTAAALSKVRSLLGDADPRTRVQAALCLSWAGECTPNVRALVIEGAQSPDVAVRWRIYQSLPPEFKKDQVLFEILLSWSKSEPGLNEKTQCILTLSVFGKNAVEPLVQVIRDPRRRSEHVAAVAALSAIGPDAAIAIPVLENLSDDPNPNVRRWAGLALNRIDRERAAKK